MIKLNRLNSAKCYFALSLLLVFLQTNMSYAIETYSVGVQDFKDYHPYSAINKNDYRGFNRDLLDMFAASQHFIFDYKIRPIKRLNYEFLSAKFDFKYPDNAEATQAINQNKTVHYSHAVMHFIDGLIVREENRGKALSELKRISVMNGFNVEKNYLLASQQGNLAFIRTNSYQRLLDLVKEKRVDGAYFDISIRNNHITDARGDNQTLVFDDSLPYITGSRSLSSIKYPEIITLFNQFLIDYKVAIEKLKAKYHINDRQEKSLPHTH